MRLKELRTQKGTKQTELCKYLGVSQSTLSLWENGKYQPDNDMLIKIAEFFGVSVDYLLGTTDEPQYAPQPDLVEQGILTGVYFQIAKDAQDLEIPPEDIQKIIELYRKYKK